jgi:hypothetical protein
MPLLIHLIDVRLGKADTSTVPPNFGLEDPQFIAVTEALPFCGIILIDVVGILYLN